MPRPYTRVEFARLAKVSRAAITKACRAGLAPACIGDRIDAEHPAAVAYLERNRSRLTGGSDAGPTKAAKPGARRSVVPTAARKPVKSRKRRPTAKRPAKAAEPVPAASDDQLEAIADVLRKLVEPWGTVRGFSDYLAALKDMEDIRKRRLQNEQTEGRLISRELVKAHILGVIDAFNRRLLTDAPKTITRRCYANAGSKVAVEDSEKMVTETIASLLEPVKTTAAKLLRDPNP